MIQYLIEVSLCWAIFFVVYWLFLRKETFFSINRYYLLGSLIAGLLIPLLKMIPETWHQETAQVIPLFHSAANTPLMISESMEYVQYAAVWDWIDFITLIYVLGLCYTFVRLIHGLNRINVLFCNGTKEKYQHFTLVRTNQVHLPFAFLFYIFISSKLDLTKSSKNILAHEITHIRAHHTLDVLFIEILNILFWFNPFIYLYKKAIRQTHEYIADAMVLEGTSAKEYSQLLLGQSSSGIELALAHSFFKSHLKNRIKMMYQKKSKPSMMVKYGMAVPVVLLMMLAFSINKNKESNSSNPQQLFTYESHYRDTISGNAFIPIVIHNKKNIKLEVRGKELQEDVDYEFAGEHIRILNNNILSKRGPLVIDVFEQGETNDCYTSDLGDEIRKRKLKYKFNQKRTDIEETIAKKVKSIREENLIVDHAIIVSNFVELILQYPLVKPTIIAAFNKEFTQDFGELVIVKLEQENLESNLAFDKYEILGSKYNVLTSPPNFNGGQIPPPGLIIDTNEIFKVVEEMPRFLSPLCESSDISLEEINTCSKKALFKFIYKNVKYPGEAKKRGVQGMAVIQFIVEQDGSLSGFKILRNPGAGTGEEALRAVQLINEFDIKWKPGMQRGQKVRVQYTLPVKFVLDEEDCDDCFPKSNNKSVGLNENIKKINSLNELSDELKKQYIAQIKWESRGLGHNFVFIKNGPGENDLRPMLMRKEILELQIKARNSNQKAISLYEKSYQPITKESVETALNSLPSGIYDYDYTYKREIYKGIVIEGNKIGTISIENYIQISSDWKDLKGSSFDKNTCINIIGPNYANVYYNTSLNLTPYHIGSQNLSPQNIKDIKKVTGEEAVTLYGEGIDEVFMIWVGVNPLAKPTTESEAKKLSDQRSGKTANVKFKISKAEIYPNPASDWLTIKFVNTGETVKVSGYTQEGKMLFRDKNENVTGRAEYYENTFDVSRLPSGTILNVIFEQNGATYSYPVIVVR